jgi:hypothetical protein
MRINCGITGLALNFCPKLDMVKFRLNLPLNFTKLFFKMPNKSIKITSFVKLNFRSSCLEFSLGGVLTPLNSKLNSQGYRGMIDFNPLTTAPPGEGVYMEAWTRREAGLSQFLIF